MNEKEILDQANLNAQYDEENSLERCGYCGAYFRGSEYLSSDELSYISATDLEEAPLGYCPNAQAEHYQQNPEQNDEQLF